MKKALLALLITVGIIVVGGLGYVYYLANGSAELVYKKLDLDGYRYSLLFPKTATQRGNKLGSVAGGTTIGAVVLQSTPTGANGCGRLNGNQAFALTDGTNQGATVCKGAIEDNGKMYACYYIHINDVSGSAHALVVFSEQQDEAKLGKFKQILSSFQVSKL